MTRPQGSHTEDEWLVVRCQLGERPAFDELIDRWHGPLSQYVRRLAPDDDSAREIVQDVWVRVLRGIGKLRDSGKLRPWLFGIARRTLMDRLRDRYAEPSGVDIDSAEIPADQDPVAFDLEEEVQAMERQLALLPRKEQETLTLFYLRELSLEQVAEVLDIPAGTVKSRLFRARQMLRRRMESEGGRS